VINGPFLPDSTLPYTFTTASDMSTAKVYSFMAFTELDYDDTLANDAKTMPVEVFGYTPIDLGDDVAIRALDYTIDAGAAYDSYLWLDSSTAQTLQVDTSGLYWLTVKQGSMCENTDTLQVTFIIPDMGIEQLSNPSDGCGLSAQEQLEFYAKNVGTDTLYTSDSLFVSYQFEGGSWIADTLYVDRTIVPGDSLLYVSDSTMDLSSVGSYLFAVNVNFKEDLILDNNHLDQSVEVFSSPQISLGEDRVVNGRSLALDAGSGFVDYLWQDGSGEQLYVAEFENQSVDSMYAVMATDMHGCLASDTVKISFDLWDVGVSSMSSPQTACLLSDREELRLYVTNYGTNPIVDEQVNIVYSVNGGNLVTAQYTLSQELNPGDSTEYLLGSSFDFSSVGDHSVVAYTMYGNDGDDSNDTLDVLISHLGVPQPNLGGDNDSLRTAALPLTLDAGIGYLSYEWNGFAGDQTFEATDYGWYVVEVMSPEGCAGRDSVYLMDPTGIKDFQLEGNLSVYPVPASRILHIKYEQEQMENLHLEVFDPAGREILIRPYSNTREIQDVINVSEMTRGVYYLRLRTDDRQIIKRIILN
jgi:hypothetical protein